MIKIGLIWGEWDTLSSVAEVTSKYLQALNNFAIVETFDAKNFNNDFKSLESFVLSKDAIWCQDFTYFHVHPDAYQLTKALLNLREFVSFGPVFFEAFGHFPQLEEEFFKFSEFFRLGDVIFFSSHADLNIFKKIVVSKSCIGVLNPWSISFNSPKKDTNEIKKSIFRELSIPCDTKVLLYVGRLNIQKNLHTILIGLKQIVKTIPNVVLIILGSKDGSCLPEFGATNYKYLSYLLDLIDKYALQNNVRFVPRTNNKEIINNFYAIADIFVNLTINHNENFGFTQLEAMSNGVPVICTDWGGLKDTVRQNKVGYKIPTYVSNWGIRVDWLEFVDKCIYLLEKPAKREKLGKQGQEFVEEYYTDNVFNLRIEKVILNAIENAKNQPSVLDQTLEFRDIIKQIQDFRHYGRKYNSENYSLYRTIIGEYASHQLYSSISKELIPFFFTDTIISQREILTTDPIWQTRFPINEKEYSILNSINNNLNICQLEQRIISDENFNESLDYFYDFLLKMHNNGIIGLHKKMEVIND